MGYREVMATFSLHQSKVLVEIASLCRLMEARRGQRHEIDADPLVYALQALVHSRAINIALEQLLVMPDPSALKQRLTSFLEALLQEQSTRPGRLACAALELAAFAVKDQSQASESCACSC